MPSVIGTVISKYQSKRAICLMIGQTVVTGTPASLSVAAALAASVPTQPTSRLNTDDGVGFVLRDPKDTTLVIKNTAGTGAVVGTFVMWGYLEANTTWYPIKVNAGAAVTTYSTDTVLYVEKIPFLGHFDRLFLELQAPGQTGGTATFEVWLLTGVSGTTHL